MSHNFLNMIQSFSDFNKLNEGRDAICGTCGEHGYDEDLDRPCSNCGDTDWTQDFDESVVNEKDLAIDVSRLDVKDASISILGGEKSEEKFREAFKDSIVIPQHPATGDVMYDGNRIGFVDSFAGLVLEDINWIKTHAEKINVIVKETGFWYG